MPKGYIKANGATVQRADYPRLIQFIESNNLWTDDTMNNAGLFGKGDGSSTFVLPDYRECMMQYTEDNIGEQRKAGLPNITGIASNYYDCGLIRTDRNPYVSGCFYEGEQTAWEIHGSVQSDMGRKLNFDASHSNPIYGSSDTVQPPAINVIPVLRY